jgi:hypothetical protein
MGFARKYILNVTNFTSHGVGADAVTTQYDLTSAFSGIRNTGTGDAYSYQAITVASLATMTIQAYNQRLNDFLSYSQIDSGTQKNNLFSEAVVDDPSCDTMPCMLNNDFTVYKFLTGVRIINIGETYGTAEYAVYVVPATTTSTTTSAPTTTTTSTTTAPIVWTTNPTFLDLNPSLTYIVLVRDNLNGEIICVTSPKTFIINNLIPSTTTTSTTTSNVSTSTTTSNVSTSTTTSNVSTSTSTIAPVTKYVMWNDAPTALINDIFEQSWETGLVVVPAMSIGDSFVVKFEAETETKLVTGILTDNICASSSVCLVGTGTPLASAESVITDSISAPPTVIEADYDLSSNFTVLPINVNKIIACAYTCRPNNLNTFRCAVTCFSIISCTGSNFVTNTDGSTFCVTTNYITP